MTATMPPFVAFLAMSLVLIIVPGPGQALTLSRTLSFGPRAGVMVALGLNTGTLVHVATAALGVSAVLAASEIAFSVLKYAGAAYLVYLATGCLLASRDTALAPSPSPGSSFRQGLAVGTLNPKVAIFFLAFLPQFVVPGGPPPLVQFLLMGSVIAVLDTAYEIALVYLASRSRIGAQGTLQRWQPAFGVVLFAMAVFLALAHR